jgi:hypothetical protein
MRDFRHGSNKMRSRIFSFQTLESRQQEPLEVILSKCVFQAVGPGWLSRAALTGVSWLDSL